MHMHMQSLICIWVFLLKVVVCISKLGLVSECPCEEQSDLVTLVW